MRGRARNRSRRRSHASLVTACETIKVVHGRVRPVHPTPTARSRARQPPQAHAGVGPLSYGLPRLLMSATPHIESSRDSRVPSKPDRCARTLLARVSAPRQKTEMSARKNSAMRLFEVRVTASRRRAIVRLEGELDMATAGDLERTVEDALNSYDELFIDLRGLRFMDSYGLWVLLRASRQARGRGIALRVIPGTGIVDRLFDLTSTRTRFELVDVTGDDAPIRSQTLLGTEKDRQIPA